jgi:hypothetical protein
MTDRRDPQSRHGRHARPDRYDAGVRGLRDAPVPDQWQDILTRAQRPPTLKVRNGNGSGPHHGRRWPIVLVAAASVAMVVGAVALVTREDPDVTTGTGITTPDPSEPDTTPDTASTTTTTTTTTTTATTTTTTGPSGSVAWVSPGELVGPNPPVSACSGFQFAAGDPPAEVDGTMQAANPQDPRLPAAVHGSISGVFEGTTTTRAVFMIAGWPGLQDDVGTYIDGPFPPGQAWTAPYPDGWLAEIAVPASEDRTQWCPYTIIGLGLTEQDMVQFLAGLSLAG